MTPSTLVTDDVLVKRYAAVRAYTDRICEPLCTEDFVVQPTLEVSPPKWHLAHTTWFFEEFLLSPYARDYKRFHPQYGFLFNSYYEQVGPRASRAARGCLSRPSVERIHAYRKYVDRHMKSLIPHLSEKALELLELGLHHEQQHQELLYTDIKFILGHNPLHPLYDRDFVETPETSADHSFASIPAGDYSIGFEGTGFSYDNERGRHRVFLPSFRIRKSLVTNEEYMQFIDDGGYSDSRYWHSDGWAWLREQGLTAPLYWKQIEGSWHRYALSGLAPVDLREPVTHVTYYEAAAFAAWAQMRLPTEFEWEAASDRFAWGLRWEHTNSAYLPYPGFAPPSGAVGEYNGKFMINQMTLRGASVATSPAHSRKTYRNFLSPDMGWQFTGIRLCKR